MGGYGSISPRCAGRARGSSRRVAFKRDWHFGPRRNGSDSTDMDDRPTSGSHPVWRREQMPDGLPSWRLYAEDAGQWSGEIHPSAAGYVIAYSLARVRVLPRFTHAYTMLGDAMLAVEHLVLPKRLRGAAASSRRAVLEIVPAAARIVVQHPVWLVRCYDSGTMHLRSRGREAWVQRWGVRTWRWVVDDGVPSQLGTAYTRYEAMNAVENVLRLSAHERLHAREALWAHLARLRALTRENVRRGRAPAHRVPR